MNKIILITSVLLFFISQNIFSQENSTKDDVTLKVYNDVKNKIDSLEKVYNKTQDESTKKELEKNKIYIKCLDNEYTFRSNYNTSDLSRENIESEIQILKETKANLKKEIHKIQKESKNYNFMITELTTKKTETKEEGEKNKIDKQVIDLKRKITNLNYEVIPREIDLMITSRELTYLWNYNKDNYENTKK